MQSSSQNVTTNKPTPSFFTGRMLFLSPNQQCQSTEARLWYSCSNSLYMLVRMGNHVLKAEDTGSFLSKTFASCLIQIKRNFDRYVVRMLLIPIYTTARDFPSRPLSPKIYTPVYRLNRVMGDQKCLYAVADPRWSDRSWSALTTVVGW